MWFWGTVSKLEMFVWVLNHISRSITWSLFTLKASHLVKWSISTWSFMWWCQFIDWLKFETRPTSLLNFGTAYSLARKATIKVFTFPSICSICKKTDSQFTGKFDRFVLKNKSAIPRLAACECAPPNKMAPETVKRFTCCRSCSSTLLV